jgi:hypothetical protein
MSQLRRPVVHLGLDHVVDYKGVPVGHIQETRPFSSWISQTPFFASRGNTPINSKGNWRLGSATFQASSTIPLASLNDSGGDGYNGQLLKGSDDMGIDDDALGIDNDALAFLVGG